MGLDLLLLRNPVGAFLTFSLKARRMDREPEFIQPRFLCGDRFVTNPANVSRDARHSMTLQHTVGAVYTG